MCFAKVLFLTRGRITPLQLSVMYYMIYFVLSIGVQIHGCPVEPLIRWEIFFLLETTVQPGCGAFLCSSSHCSLLTSTTSLQQLACNLGSNRIEAASPLRDTCGIPRDPHVMPRDSGRWQTAFLLFSRWAKGMRKHRRTGGIKQS